MSSFVLVLRNENKENCLIQSKTNPVTNLGHFKIHCAIQSFHPSSQSRSIKFWKSSILVITCPIECLQFTDDHCTKGFTAIFISWGAQMGITSKILNRLLSTRCQNTRKSISLQLMLLRLWCDVWVKSYGLFSRVGSYFLWCVYVALYKVVKMHPNLVAILTYCWHDILHLF